MREASRDWNVIMRSRGKTSNSQFIIYWVFAMLSYLQLESWIPKHVARVDNNSLDRNERNDGGKCISEFHFPKHGQVDAHKNIPSSCNLSKFQKGDMFSHWIKGFSKLYCVKLCRAAWHWNEKQQKIWVIVEVYREVELWSEERSGRKRKLW